jgi:hypothetical protein
VVTGRTETAVRRDREKRAAGASGRCVGPAVVRWRLGGADWFVGVGGRSDGVSAERRGRLEQNIPTRCWRTGMRMARRRAYCVVTARDRSVVAWIGVIGAVSAQGVMARFGVGRTVGLQPASGARGPWRRVAAAPRLRPAGAVHGDQPGLAWAGLSQLDPARAGVATTRHWALCARLAVELERSHRVEVWGRPAATRRRARSRPRRRKQTRPARHAAQRLRRPDSVLFPATAHASRFAIEVELSAEDPRRLKVSCRGWAHGRARCPGPLLRYAAAGAVPFPPRSSGLLADARRRRRVPFPALRSAVTLRATERGAAGRLA